MAFDQDPAEFFDTDDFAVSADWTPAGETAALPVDGIFSNDYADQFDVDATRPAFLCNSADVSGVAKGDALTVYGLQALGYSSESQAFIIASPPESDSTGITRLVLKNA